MDEDLDRMSREELIAEARKLRQGIRAHRDSTGQELCWHHPALWGLLPERGGGGGLRPLFPYCPGPLDTAGCGLKALPLGSPRSSTR